MTPSGGFDAWCRLVSDTHWSWAQERTREFCPMTSVCLGLDRARPRAERDRAPSARRDGASQSSAWDRALEMVRARACERCARAPEMCSRERCCEGAPGIQSESSSSSSSSSSAVRLCSSVGRRKPGLIASVRRGCSSADEHPLERSRSASSRASSLRALSACELLPDHAVEALRIAAPSACIAREKGALVRSVALSRAPPRRYAPTFGVRRHPRLYYGLLLCLFSRVASPPTATFLVVIIRIRTDFRCKKQK